MENIGDTLGTGKPQKKYWLRFGIIAALIPIILSLFLVVMGGLELIVILLDILSFRIPSTIDDMGIRGTEGLVLLAPILWFVIGAVIGWIYGLIKVGNYKAAKRVFIVIALVAIGIVSFAIKGGYGISPAARALEERNIKYCDKLSYQNYQKHYCYSDLGELGDYSICEQSTDEEFKGVCIDSVAETLGECEKIDSDRCYLLQSYNVQRMAKDNNCSDGNLREKILCEQYIKKEITDHDLCEKISNNSEERDLCASSLGECEKIQSSFHKDGCFSIQADHVRRMVKDNTCSDGNSREKMLCEQYIKKEITDHDLCRKISNDNGARDECIDDAVLSLGECEKIQSSNDKIDDCYYIQSINVQRMARKNNCSDGNSREKMLCEQYIKKEITDDDLCGKLNDSSARDACERHTVSSSEPIY